MRFLTVCLLVAIGISASTEALSRQPDKIEVFISRLMMDDPAGAADLIVEPVKQLDDHQVVPGRLTLNRSEFVETLRTCQVVRFMRPTDERGPQFPRKASYNVDLLCAGASRTFVLVPDGERVMLTDYEQWAENGITTN